MEGEFTWIGPLKESKHGGCYRVVTLRIFGDEKQAKVFLDPDCKNYKNWEQILQKGNIVGGLVWKNKESRIIDADSPVHLL
ncbi:MAG: hypothetical protein A3H60_01340 [Candidatus Zambryskibacteria bacterium RIFCSPLOWO2_02_FULL_44_12b]|uniref:Uncharacterized protein n=1 Tax=Candidatus Zambryskibacteria bacterium RIFCSPLOWO2_02_FULL_44_12b TaxID=1802772 RepID=A0A1G2ULV3_9BACT|nr:MAG: hypothetical protein A3H60_01340 [Candidatus Zambryskibacteria bacterium RIFCSPLOWO2_02_FULL_44_12b]